MQNLGFRGRRAPKWLDRSFRLETGFSMLEAVVVVGVLLALAIGGFFAYGAITENAKKAKVKSEASKLHTAALVANTDNESDNSAQNVLDEYNYSADRTRAEFLDKDLTPVTGVFTPTLDQDFCVKVSYKDDPETYAINGACTTHIPSGNGGTNPGDGGSQVNTIYCGASKLDGVKPLTSTNPFISSSMLNYMNCQLLQSYSPELLSWAYSPALYTSTDVFKNLKAVTVGNAADIDVGNLQSTIASNLYDKYVEELYSGFYVEQTPESQIIAADAQRAMYEYIIANANQQPYRMVATPSQPEKFFNSVTVASGTKEQIKMTVAVPSNIELKYDIGNWGIREDYAQVTSSSGTFANSIDGGYRNWELTMTPGENWDKNKTYTGTAWITDKNGIQYIHAFEIKVQ